MNTGLKKYTIIYLKRSIKMFVAKLTRNTNIDEDELTCVKFKWYKILTNKQKHTKLITWGI